MNKGFNDLSIEKQIDFINEELQRDKNISVTKLCKKIGVNKNTIVSRFTKAGYKYNVDGRQYIKENEVIQKNNKSITDKVATEKENNNDVQLQEFKKEIKELLDMKEQLKEIIQEYNKSKNIKISKKSKEAELKINKDNFHGELKGRLIKVYDNVNDTWIEFCKENSQYKMQDLYSMALLEFVQKYKK